MGKTKEQVRYDLPLPTFDTLTGEVYTTDVKSGGVPCGMWKGQGKGKEAQKRGEPNFRTFWSKTKSVLPVPPNSPLVPSQPGILLCSSVILKVPLILRLYGDSHRHRAAFCAGRRPRFPLDGCFVLRQRQWQREPVPFNKETP